MVIDYYIGILICDRGQLRAHGPDNFDRNNKVSPTFFSYAGQAGGHPQAKHHVLTYIFSDAPTTPFGVWLVRDYGFRQ